MGAPIFIDGFDGFDGDRRGRGDFFPDLPAVRLPPLGQTEKTELLVATLGRPVTLAYGEHVVGGNVLLQHELSDTQTVIFQALGAGQWDSARVVWVNGLPIDLADTAKFHFHPGLDGQPTDETTPATANQQFCSFWPFNSRMTFSRTAYISLKLALDPEAPGPGYDIRGIYRTSRVRTFNRSGTLEIFQYSPNPAWIALDLLIRRFLKPHGLVGETLTAAEKARIDFPSFFDWAADCDFVTPQGTKRCEAHIAFVDRVNLMRALEQVLLLGRGYIIERLGKFFGRLEKARTPLATLGELDLESFELREKDAHSLANRYTGRYRSLDSGTGPGTISTTGTAVTGSGTDFLRRFKKGSAIRLEDGSEEGEVGTFASVSSDIPTAARWRLPRERSTSGFSVNGNWQPAATIRCSRTTTPMSCRSDPGQKIVLSSSVDNFASMRTPDSMTVPRPTWPSMATKAPILFFDIWVTAATNGSMTVSGSARNRRSHLASPRRARPRRSSG